MEGVEVVQAWAFAGVCASGSPVIEMDFAVRSAATESGMSLSPAAIERVLAPGGPLGLQLRVFYAANDIRTPALINLAMVAMMISAVTLSAAWLPDTAVVVALPAAGSLSYVVGSVARHLVLRRCYGLFGFRIVLEMFSRALWASIAASIV